MIDFRSHQSINKQTLALIPLSCIYYSFCQNRSIIPIRHIFVLLDIYFIRLTHNSTMNKTIALFSPFFLPSFSAQSDSISQTRHTLTTIWSNPNLHRERPFPWWLTKLKPHPEGFSFSCFFSFTASLHPFCLSHTNTRQPLCCYPPCSHWLLTAVNYTGEDDFGLRLWPHWLQVQRLDTSTTLVLGFIWFQPFWPPTSLYRSQNKRWVSPTHIQSCSHIHNTLWL